MFVKSPRFRLLVYLLFFCVAFLSAPAVAASKGPLIVDQNSHVVVMEYEAWFGPNAVTFQGTAAKPLLQSADMQSPGGGYDSADPAVIQQHVQWMEQLGVDAAIADLTNNVSCIFNSEWFARKYLKTCSPAFRSNNQSIRDNTGNLFPAWAKLGTNLKIIPQLGGIEFNVLYPDRDGETSLEKEINYFGKLFEQYPEREVIYKGKPLMLIFLGAAQDPTLADKPLWARIRQFIESRPDLNERYTFKLIAGYLDSQPGLWLNQGPPAGPIEINPLYDFWSWVDRLNPKCTVAPFCPYFPSYNVAGSRVENFTASLATAGQNGWGCPNSEAPPYCADDSLRFADDQNKDHAYDTFSAFMAYARRLQPIFLIIHQFNEFVQPDEGWNAQTDDDTEPANLWDFTALDAVQNQIQMYREESAALH
jgi:hypothetical protein